MAGWCAEKSEGVVECITRSLAILTSIEGTEPAQAQLRLALSYATKLYAFGMGAEWRLEHPSLVVERGFGPLAVAYGATIDVIDERRSLNELFAAIESLLAGPPSPNRTHLHELLRNHRNKQTTQRLARFGELLEQVTQGELAWPDFVEAARADIAAARSAESNSSPP